MNSWNLAIVFSPNIFFGVNSNNVKRLERETVMQNLLTQCMIEDYDALFIDTRGSGGKEQELRKTHRRNRSNSNSDIAKTSIFRNSTRYEKPSPTSERYEFTQSSEDLVRPESLEITSWF